MIRWTDMDERQRADYVARRNAASRRAQGLPRHVEDAGTLTRIAALVRAGLSDRRAS